MHTADVVNFLLVCVVLYIVTAFVIRVLYYANLHKVTRATLQVTVVVVMFFFLMTIALKGNTANGRNAIYCAMYHWHSPWVVRHICLGRKERT